MIKVKLFATLREGRGKIIEIEYNKQEKIIDILNKLDIDIKDVAILLKNGLDANINDVLVDNDVISIFPPVGGG